MNEALPREMQQHTYAIMDRVEDKHWWFVGRRAILESFMRGIVAKIGARPSAIRILDVGCGTGANLEMLSQFGEAEGVDVSDDALEFCRGKGLNVQKGLAEKLPYEDGAFDVTTALDVVEHLDDDIAGQCLVDELSRVVRSADQRSISLSKLARSAPSALVIRRHRRPTSALTPEQTSPRL